MKKILTFLLMFSMTFLLISCDFLDSLTSESNNTTEAITDVPTTINEDTESSIETTIEVTTIVETTTETIITTEVTTAPVTTAPVTTVPETTIEVTTQPTTETTSETTTQNTTEPIIPTGYNLVQDETYWDGIPTIGTPKVLVFVVDFPDSQIEDDAEVLSDMEIAFNGSDTEIDYESLNSYYLKSSYGQLDLTADIFGVYTADYNASYYEQQYETEYSDSDLVYEIVEAYSTQIDYSNYDYDDDGMIDGIYIIYNKPYDFDSEIWWAYQTIYMYNGDIFNGVEPLFFTWCSLDFFYDNPSEEIDARTVIHETGHMLGLDDYYDYYEGDIYNNSGGLDGIDMMDSTMGDHNPFSKILLGWVTPYVVEQSMTVDIAPFIEEGNVILLIDEWNDTIFDEYILISFYTPTGLNEADRYYLFSNPGVVMFHVDARLGNTTSEYYPSIYTYNNTDTEFMLIKYIEKSIQTSTSVNNADLFLIGDSFGDVIYSDYTWHDGSYVAVIITIVYIDDEKATINIEFN